MNSGKLLYQQKNFLKAGEKMHQLSIYKGIMLTAFGGYVFCKTFLKCINKAPPVKLMMLWYTTANFSQQAVSNINQQPLNKMH